MYGCRTLTSYGSMTSTYLMQSQLDVSYNYVGMSDYC